MLIIALIVVPISNGTQTNQSHRTDVLTDRNDVLTDVLTDVLINVLTDVLINALIDA